MVATVTTSRTKYQQRIYDTLQSLGPLCWSDVLKYTNYAADTVRRELVNWAEVQPFTDHQGAKLYRVTKGKEMPTKTQTTEVEAPAPTSGEDDRAPVEEQEPEREQQPAPAIVPSNQGTKDPPPPPKEAATEDHNDEKLPPNKDRPTVQFFRAMRTLQNAAIHAEYEAEKQARIARRMKYYTEKLAEKIRVLNDIKTILEKAEQPIEDLPGTIDFLLAELKTYKARRPITPPYHDLIPQRRSEPTTPEGWTPPKRIKPSTAD